MSARAMSASAQLPKQTGWAMLALSLISFFSSGQSVLAAEVRLTLKSEARVAQRILRIADVAQIEGDSRLAAEIGRLDLAQLGALSHNLPIGAQTVSFRLMLAGHTPSVFQLSGASRCLVSLDKFELSGEDLIDTLRADFAKKRGLAPEKIEATLSHHGALPRRRFRADDEIALIVTEAPAHEPLKAGTTPDPQREYLIRVLARGREEAVIPTLCSFQRWESVVESARELPQGTTLAAAHTRIVRRLVPADWQGPSSQDRSWFEGKSLLQALPEGQILKPADLSATAPVKENPILIRQRELVKITARVGGFMIHTTGEAMQEGRSGELIRVRNLDSKSMILARVLDKGAVQLEY